MNFDYDKLLKEMDFRKFGSAQRILLEEQELRHNAAAYESFNQARQYQWVQESSLIRYIVGGMLPVAQNYTQQIISCRKSVENVLKQMNDNIYYSAPLEFKYQGSVSNNTHIRHNSDVDLLTIIGLYETLEHPQRPQYPYKGVPENDLAELRNNCVGQIKKVMSSVHVDNSGAKSIALSGGSLIVKVDVVPANWFNSNRYAETNNAIYRGIQIYNKRNNERILNYPFWFNDLLKNKDSFTGGVFKRAIRLLKTIKTDAERELGAKINFSSYAISSLLYTIPTNKYWIGESPLTLLKVINETLEFYGHEKNFSKLLDPLGDQLSSSESIEGVRQLQSVTSMMLGDIGDDINRVIKIA
ncbi:MAG: hypothetical protein J1F66_00495 [Clostridiales bacterium]|nr:hypothetical protein [Clostridiales bacterium]